MYRIIYRLKILNPGLKPLFNSPAASGGQYYENPYTAFIGLFSPARYEIEYHNGYNIAELGDYYRSLSILKNRDGEANIKVPLFFNGASDIFKELPKPDNEEGLNAVRNLIRRIEEG